MLKIWAVLGVILLAIALIAPALGQMTEKDWFDKGVALADQSKYDEAIKCYNKAIGLNSSDSDV
ncbi:MAG: tetratricopeptide repeat protein [Methanotrichaceae archaeon]